jgi:bifunctional non-homologous end joining protein LigD
MEVTIIPEAAVMAAAGTAAAKSAATAKKVAAQKASAREPIDSGNEDLIGVADRAELLSLIQFGVIELHPWGARTAALDTADRIIFDLDPDESLPFRLVTDAAKVVRQRLDELGLKSFPKTTGGKGMHVVVPLRPGHPWPVVKAAAKAISTGLARDLPDVFVAQSGAARRKNRIFIDYLRNDRTATAVAAWSARARPGLTVAWPLAWKDVTAKLDPKAYTVAKLLARGTRLPADPWKDMATTRQSLTAARLKALGVET